MINKFDLVKRILGDLKVNPDRLSLEWVSAAEAPRFVRVITEFTNRIRDLGPIGSREGLDLDQLKVKLKAAKMALESNEPVATLRKRVTSPGGTTEQGLRVMNEHNIDQLLADVLKAAHDRSRELARMLGKD